MSDKFFDRLMCGAVVAWVVSVVLSIAVGIVVIWAIIQVVSALT